MIPGTNKPTMESTEPEASRLLDRVQAAVMPVRLPGSIVRDSYGKSTVRLTKVTRHPDHHDIKEISVDIQLEGEFKDSYTKGDNSRIVATDSMKNTVYVLAHHHILDTIESFAKTLSAHFLDRYSQVSKAVTKISEQLWQRLEFDHKPHPHAFVGAGVEFRTTLVKATREGLTITSGIENLPVVKTTASEFHGYVKDEFTTLPEARDRIFGTLISAQWLNADHNSDFNQVYDIVRRTMLEVFASQHSLSVQQTLHQIGQSVLSRTKYIQEISITMPNQHRILFNLQPFGLENANEIFVNTDEPYGLISATIARN